MSPRYLALALLTVACAPVEGIVLVLRDASAPASEEAGPDAELDGGAEDAESADAAREPLGVCRITSSEDGFGDNFDGVALDPAHWLVAHGAPSFAGKAEAGGFVRENVSVESGALVLRVRGDRYAGAIRGIDALGRPLASGQRTAAAVATRDLFQSGTYQVQGLLTGPAGVELALWVQRDDDRQGAIDIATPGLDGVVSSHARVRMRSRDALNGAVQQQPLAAAFESGSSHSLRFDWYTTATPGVTFWVDDHQLWQTAEPLPTGGAARLWIVAWAPDDVPLDFETAEVRIQSMFIRPFANSGDRCRDGELSGPGLVAP